MRKIFTLLFFLSSATVFCQSGSWAWMNGNNFVNGTGTWGTQGVFAAGNKPPATYESAEWRDKNGDFWLFGGLNTNEQNMLWKYDRSLNQWAWMKGSSTCCQNGVYGTQTIPDPANHPGARSWGAITWTDTSGNLWLFGGYGYDKLGNVGNLDDVWKYDPVTNEWAWMHGSEFNGVNAFYGTLGVAGVLNTPGNRCEFAASWTDCSTNTLWLFGGWNFSGTFNDVWKYDIADNTWTWIKGSNLQGAAAVYGTKGIPAPNNTPSARRSYCKWKDVDGNFWTFGGLDYNSQTYDDLWKYDPVTNEWTWISGTNTLNNLGDYNAYCTPDSTAYPSSRYENRACWTDGDGKFWLFGGLDPNFSCKNDLWYYDPATHEWTWVNGSSFGGSDIWGTQGVASPLNHPGARAGSIAWTDDSSHLWLYGGKDFSTNNSYNDLWKFIPDAGCGKSATPGFPGGCTTFVSPPFNSSSTNFCQNFCIDFTDLSLNNPSAWQWIFPGGSPSTSTLQNPVNICYNTPGIYDVTLITSNAGGSDTSVLSNFITVNAPPVSPVIFQNDDTLISSAASVYQWYLNGVAIPGAMSQQLIITQTGDYSVSISDSAGCQATDTITVLSLTSVSFGADDVSICEKFCVDFSDQSINNPSAWQWIFPGGSPSTSTLQDPLNICYNNPGIYDVTLIATYANGNDTLTLPAYITVYNTPNIPIISQAGFTLISTPAATYQWQLNSVAIPGATNQSYDVIQTGYYTVFITDENGCTSLASQLYVQITGMENISAGENISLYPNPADGSFTVSWENGEITGEALIEIVNTIGQIVFSETEKNFATHFSKTITLPGYAAGMYILSIKTTLVSVNKKLILNH